MYDFTEYNLTISTTCESCLDLDTLCAECQEARDAQDTVRAEEIVEEGLVVEGYNIHKQDDQPSASDWTHSVTYRGIARKVAQMTEIWDDQCHLVEISVKFVDPTEAYDLRHEFLPPIVQLVDGGELDNLWELQDETQSARERECKWCHLLTPKMFPICTSCDNPQE